jgi:serine/threonine protein kinase
MERVEGTSLDRLEPRPVGWREVVRLFVQAGRGLAAAHDKALVHRDVKPHNLLVGRDGRASPTSGSSGSPQVQQSSPRGAAASRRAAPCPGPRRSTTPLAARPLSQCGMRKAAAGRDAHGAGALARQLTHAAARLGTPRDMAPEQRLRRPATALSDQFSFWEGLQRRDRVVQARGRSRAQDLRADSENRIIGLQGTAACLVELGRAADASPLFEQMLEIAANNEMQPYKSP